MLRRAPPPGPVSVETGRVGHIGHCANKFVLGLALPVFVIRMNSVSFAIFFTHLYNHDSVFMTHVSGRPSARAEAASPRFPLKTGRS